MADENQKGAVPPRLTELKEITIGYDADPPTCVQIMVPIAAYARNEKNGRALMIGELHEAREHCDFLLNALRAREKQKGIIPVAGGNIPPPTVR